ncbi:MAG: hypothetical protein AAF329_01765 [Cyanobacteria bacterium P01_A01_bin.17]
MTSSFLRTLPAPLQNVSSLAMLASVGAHIIFFAGSSLLSAQESETPEKLRVVSLLPSQQSAVQQPPQNPNAPLPVPALPPKGQASFEGLPTLRPGEQPQAFRQLPTANANPNLQALAQKQQALRRELALRRQQQAIQQQQRSIQAQRQAQQQAQQQALQRQRVLEAARQQQAQQQARANPLTNDPPGGWSKGSEDLIPRIAAGQTTEFGQQGNGRDGFGLPAPPPDTKGQASGPGRNPAPVDLDKRKLEISKINDKIKEYRAFAEAVKELSPNKTPSNEIKGEQTIVSPAGVDLSELDGAVVEVRTYITKEGEKAATRVVEKAEQEVLNQAAKAAVEKYQPEKSEFGKTLVFRYGFKPSGAAPAAPGQASDAAQPEGKTAEKDSKDSANSPEKKDGAGKEDQSTAVEDKKKDESTATEDSKPETKEIDDQPAAQTAPKPDDKPATPAVEKTETQAPSAAGRQAPAALKQLPAAASPQPSAPEPKDVTDDKNKTSDAIGGAEQDTASQSSAPASEAESESDEEAEGKESATESEPLPSSYEENLLKKLKLDSLKK